MKLFYTAILLAGFAFSQPAPKLKTRSASASNARSLSRHPRHWIVPRESASKLLAAGGTVLADAGGEKVLISSSEPIAGAEAIDSESKISAALVEPDHFLVTFYRDVPEESARRVLEQTGLELIRSADLLPHQYLVTGTEEKAHAVAKWDEVAYVYPASPEMVEGQPVFGCPGPLTDLGSVGQYVANFGEGWDGPGAGSAQLSYSVSKYSSSLPREVTVTAIEQALAEWSRAADIHFSFDGNPFSYRNLDISFVTGAHNDPYPFDGRGRTLAHTFYPADVNPEPIAGDLHFDDDEAWEDGGQFDFYSVLLHELGHALGLGHSDRPQSVMYPYYRKQTTLQAEDVQAIQRLYAPPSAPVENVPAQRPSNLLTISIEPVKGTTADYADLTGSVSGGAGDVQVTWSSTSGAGNTEGRREWVARSIPLMQGTNRITISAVDEEGTAATTSVTIVRMQAATTGPAPSGPSVPVPTVPVPTAPVPSAPVPSAPVPAAKDSAPPSLNVKSPVASTLSTSATTMQISGTAHDNVDVTSVTWTSGSRSGSATGTSSWSFELSLYVGSNPVVVRAWDAAGNSSWRSLTITRK